MSDWERCWWIVGIMTPVYLAMDLSFWVELLVAALVAVVVSLSWNRLERLTERRLGEDA